MKKVYLTLSGFIFSLALIAQTENIVPEMSQQGSTTTPNKNVVKHQIFTGNSLNANRSNSAAKPVSKNVSRDGVVLFSEDFSDPTAWVMPDPTPEIPNTGFRIGNTATGIWTASAAIWGEGNTENRTLNSTSGGNFLYFSNGTTELFGTPDFFTATLESPIDMSDETVEAALFSFELAGARFFTELSVEFSVDGTNWLTAYSTPRDFEPLTADPTTSVIAPFVAPTIVEFEVPRVLLGEEEVFLRFTWIPTVVNFVSGPAVNWIDYVYGIDDIEIFSIETEPSGVVIWSDDFENGLDNWTTTGSDASEWYHAMPLLASEVITVPAGWIGTDVDGLVDYTRPPSGAFNRWGFARIQSFSRGNGWASISPDSFNNTETGWPSTTAAPEANLVSPVIDVSDFEGSAIGIRYTQGSRVCCGDASFNVDVTTDGFVTFESYEVQIAVNDSEAGREVTLNVTLGVEGGDLSNFQFRFRNNAPTYYWHIDDVEVFTIEESNIVLERAFYAPYFTGAPQQAGNAENREFTSIVINSETAQATTITPGALVTNVGGSDLTNVILTVSITGPGDFVEILNSTPINIGLGLPDTLFTAPYTFSSAAAPGVYNLNYTITAEETFGNPNLATTNRTIRVSEWEYAVDIFQVTGTFTNTTSGTEADNNISGNYRLGTDFFIFEDATVHGLGVVLANTSTPNTLFTMELWEVSADGTEDLVEILDAEVPANIEDLGNEILYFDFPDAQNLDADNTYRIYVNHFEDGSPGNPGPKVFVQLGGSSPGLLSWIDYLSADERFFTTSIPMLRMNLNADFVSVPSLEREQLAMKAFPNPSSSNFEIQYILEADAVVQFELTDMTGKVLLRRDEGRQAGNVQHNFTVNAQNLSSGIYLYSIIVDGKRNTKKLMKN
ncbi:MAG: T9SS type A sorting domain-containing protein [Luteibaculaceae bacterium]